MSRSENTFLIYPYNFQSSSFQESKHCAQFLSSPTTLHDVGHLAQIDQAHHYLDICFRLAEQIFNARSPDFVIE